MSLQIFIQRMYHIHYCSDLYSMAVDVHFITIYTEKLVLSIYIYRNTVGVGILSHLKLLKII